MIVTVADLIEELEALPPTAEVRVADLYGQVYTLHEVQPLRLQDGVSVAELTLDY